jgi:hypothetical protein
MFNFLGRNSSVLPSKSKGDDSTGSSPFDFTAGKPVEMCALRPEGFALTFVSTNEPTSIHTNKHIMKALLNFVPFCLILFAVTRSETSANVYIGTGSRGSNCSGSGICTISSDATSSASYKAKIGYDSHGKLFLEFDYIDLPAEVRAAQFGADQFEMQSDCPVPADVMQSIHSEPYELNLKQGFYPIDKREKSVRIYF